MERLLKEICPEKRWHDYLDRKDLDLAHEVPGSRVSAAIFSTITGARPRCFRQIPAKILSFDDLKLPRR
jgi:twitching motility protein PilT